MFKIYKRDTGKNWQISYKVGMGLIRKTTRTDLFCNAILYCKHIEKEIESKKRMEETRQRMAEKYFMAERIMIGKEKPKPSIDGFDTFYLDYRDTPDSCNENFGIVYIVKRAGLIKIGITKHPRQRLKTIEIGGGTKLDIIYLSKQCINYFNIEKLVHNMFDEQRSLGEWFAADFMYAVYKFQEINIDACESKSGMDVLRRYAEAIV